MRALLAGLAIVLASLGGFTTAAGAAEIPPTPECSKLLEKLAREQAEFLALEPSSAEEKRAERTFIRALAKAGCISDAEAIIKPLKAKPFSKECAVAAKSLDRFLSPLTRRMKPLQLARRNALKPLNRRIHRVMMRVDRLRARGASKNRIRRLEKAQFRLVMRKSRVDEASYKRMTKVAAPYGSDSSLIVFELLSLRCMSLDWMVEGALAGNLPKDPVSLAMRKHMMSVWMSIMGFSDKVEALGSSSSISRDGIPSLGHSGS